MSEYLCAALGGAAAAAIATLPMSAVMLTADKVGLIGTQPPELVVEKSLAAAGAEPSEPVKTTTAVTVHFGFGAAAGAPFGVIYSRMTPQGPPIARGIGYGLAVYTAS
ncbi:MAG: hypothetical protein M3068_02905 [Gemmatimonadota bacterium]|nr:hypothetical protein [Gemmatimonadota bacterium]